MVAEDKFGNTYTDNYEKLTYVVPGQKELTVNVNTKYIYGESQDKNAFYTCRGIQKVIFPTGSMLQKIENSAFYQCSSLNNLDLSVCTQLEYIEDNAFFETSALASIKFPQSLKSINFNSFHGSGIAGTLTIPIGVTHIGSDVFSYCLSLTEVNFQEGIQLTSILSGTFSRSGLVKISFPPSVSSIDGFALHGNPALKLISVDKSNHFKFVDGMLLDKNGEELIACAAAYSTEEVTLPTGVKIISDCGFHSCRAKRITLCDTLESIGQHAFRETVIDSIVMPNSVTSCSNSIFEGCKNLKNVTLSNQLQKITDYMFKDSGIETIVIPDSVKSIGANCFQNCVELGTVTLPKQITDFGGGAFSGCVKLNLSFAEGSPFDIDKQFLITSNQIVVSQYIGPNPGATVEIPATVQKIDVSSFSLNTNIEHITFAAESALKSIEYRAFYKCTNLKTFQFPAGLKVIKESAFEESGLESVTFGDSISELHIYAFRFCNRLTSVTFPQSTADITLGDFVFQCCNRIESFTFPEGLTMIGSNFLTEAVSLHEIVLPSTLTEIKEKAFFKSGLRSVTFKAATSQLIIGDFAFSQSKSLSDFQFVDGITSLGIYAFAHTNLSLIELPKTVTTISERCFSDCSSLTNATLAKDQTYALSSIGDAIFQGSTNLEAIVCQNDHFSTKNGALYNNGFTTIYAFPPASSAHFIYLPAELKIISSGTFHSCTNLYTVLITDDTKLEQIGALAFAGCCELRSINIPISVTTVSKDAFIDCTSLACGLVIENQNEDYRNDLVKVARMPKRCLNKCEACPSVVKSRLSPIRFSTLFAAFLFTYQ